MNGHEFEDLVHNIALRLWPSAPGGGRVMEGGRERDGVYVSEEGAYCVEATIDRSLDKAKKDGKKLAGLVKSLQTRYPEKAVKGFFVTREEPTADQRSEVQCHGHLVVAMSFNTFYAKLCDSWQYLKLREDYPFGSDANPEARASRYNDKIVPIRLTNVNKEKDAWDVKKVVGSLDKGERITVIGQYGVGKSVCGKEVFKQLRERHQSGRSLVFPIYINLRDHHGQNDPAEVLERHATKLGYGNKHHLVRAWRAGFVLPILDGFDETAALGWARLGKKLKQIRSQSVELIRAFGKQTPAHIGVLMSGRNNYFDTREEMMDALGVNKSKPVLEIQDFSEDQVVEYFTLLGLEYKALPKWVPNKPLLLGYLLTRGMGDAMSSVQNMSPAEGWEYLVDRICERESDIDVGMTASNIRELIEAAASVARKSQSGLGPVSQADLEHAFQLRFGYEPDERAFVLLQRLPALSAPNAIDGMRYFVDVGLADFAKTGELLEYIKAPYSYQFATDVKKWFETISSDAVGFLAHRVGELEESALQGAAIAAYQNDSAVLTSDIMLCMAARGHSWPLTNVVVSDVLLSHWELNSELDWSKVIFRECTIRMLDAEDRDISSRWPSFEGCLIAICWGLADAKGLPAANFTGTEVDEFETTAITTTSILSLDLPTPVRVGLSILKKVFMQVGSGRMESALYRGLDHSEIRYVSDVLELFKRESVIVPTKQRGSIVWLPARDQAQVVRDLVRNPTEESRLIRELKRLA